MTEKKLISIITPNYNDSNHIGQTIESVLSQSYKNIELIVIDDGSTDNSIEVIHRYRSDSRLKLISRKQNKGAVYSSNEGLAHASGEYIYFLSANDFLLPDFFALSGNELFSHPELGVSTTDAIELRVSDQSYHTFSFIPWIKKPIYFNNFELPQIYLKSYLKLSGSCCILRTELVRTLGGFSEAMHCSSDWYLITKIAFMTGLAYIPRPLMCWRNLPNGYSQRTLKDKRVAKVMYSNLLDDLATCDKTIVSLFKKTGELGCILKFARSEIFRRPKFWPHCPYALLRYVIRTLKKMAKSVVAQRYHFMVF